MPIRRLIASLAAIVLTLVVAARADDQTYSIRLERPTTVGARFKVSGTSTQEVTVTRVAGGIARQSEPKKTALVYEGRLEVTKVDANGRPSQVRVTFDKCELTGPDGAKKDPVAKDGVVTIERQEHKPVLTLKDGELDDDASKALARTGLVPDDSVSDDEILGTATPRKIGDKWDINPKAAAKDIATKGASADDKDITGSATLKATRAVDKIDCLEVVAELNIAKVVPPADQVPAGITVDKNSVKATVTGLYPRDPKAQPLSITVVTQGSTEMSATDPNGNEVKLKLEVKEERTEQRRAE